MALAQVGLGGGVPIAFSGEWVCPYCKHKFRIETPFSEEALVEEAVIEHKKEIARHLMGHEDQNGIPESI